MLKVKLREIQPCLPCLLDQEQENKNKGHFTEIEAIDLEFSATDSTASVPSTRTVLCVAIGATQLERATDQFVGRAADKDGRALRYSDFEY